MKKEGKVTVWNNITTCTVYDQAEDDAKTFGTVELCVINSGEPGGVGYNRRGMGD